MHISDIIKKGKTTLSFEFFPPKSEKGAANLYSAINDLVQFKPSYVSVTYGAGGSTRELTRDLVLKIQNETDITVVSHLTCVGATKEEIHEILKTYADNGITNIMALRGDPPAGETEFKMVEGGFNHAGDLVAFIKKNFPEMGIGVAGFPEGHPATPNRLDEMDYLKAKVDAGADYICTQLFFDNRDFYDFCERCEVAGIHVPIVAGVMPVTTLNSMHRMADLSAGSRFPAKLLRSLYRADSDEQVEKAGLHWAAEQVQDLIDNKVAGIHLYTLNKSAHVKEIYKSIGIASSEQL